MKARITSCEQCKKKAAKEQEKKCLGCQFDMFAATVDDIGKAMTAAMIAVCERRGRTPEYIRKFFDDLVFMLEYPAVFGKELHSERLKEEYTQKYNIDFSRIRVKTETKEECFRRYKIR